MSRSCEEDPAFDYVLTLLLEPTAEPLTVLPTHRLVARAGEDGVPRLLDRPATLFCRAGPARRRSGAIRAPADAAPRATAAAAVSACGRRSGGAHS